MLDSALAAVVKDEPLTPTSPLTQVQTQELDDEDSFVYDVYYRLVPVAPVPTSDSTTVPTGPNYFMDVASSLGLTRLGALSGLMDDDLELMEDRDSESEFSEEEDSNGGLSSPSDAKNAKG